MVALTVYLSEAESGKKLAVKKVVNSDKCWGFQLDGLKVA